MQAETCPKCGSDISDEFNWGYVFKCGSSINKRGKQFNGHAEGCLRAQLARTERMVDVLVNWIRGQSCMSCPCGGACDAVNMSDECTARIRTWAEREAGGKTE